MWSDTIRLADDYYLVAVRRYWIIPYFKCRSSWEAGCYGGAPLRCVEPIQRICRLGGLGSSRLCTGIWRVSSQSSIITEIVTALLLRSQILYAVYFDYLITLASLSLQAGSESYSIKTSLTRILVTKLSTARASRTNITLELKLYIEWSTRCPS